MNQHSQSLYLRMMTNMELQQRCCWMASLAIWTPFPSDQGSASASTAFIPLKTTSKGVWLKSGPAAVELLLRGSDAAEINVSISSNGHHRRRVLSATLGTGTFSCLFLCQTHADSKPVLLCTINLPARPNAPFADPAATFALRFEAAQSARECAAALHGLCTGTLHLTAAAQQGPRLAAVLAADGGTSDAAMLAAVHQYLYDPEFTAYVNRMEALWVELEQSVDAGTPGSFHELAG